VCVVDGDFFCFRVTAPTRLNCFPDASARAAPSRRTATCSAPQQGFSVLQIARRCSESQMIKAIVLAALLLVAAFAVPILEADPTWDADTTFTVTDDKPVPPSEFG
jgi:hypothetical protein